MRHMLLWSAVLTGLFGLVGCGGDRVTRQAKNEVQSTLDTLITLAETGDFEALVDAYYAETHTSRADREELLRRFRARGKENLADAFQQAKKLHPNFAKDRQSVLFVGPGIRMTLVRTQEGWKFTL